MLALYRAGRQAEALEAYRSARETLVGSSASNRARSWKSSSEPFCVTIRNCSPTGRDGGGPRGPRSDEDRLDRRPGDQLGADAGRAGGLARRHPDRELVLASTVSSSEDLLEVTQAPAGGDRSTRGERRRRPSRRLHLGGPGGRPRAPRHRSRTRTSCSSTRPRGCSRTLDCCRCSMTPPATSLSSSAITPR